MTVNLPLETEHKLLNSFPSRSLVISSVVVSKFPAGPSSKYVSSIISGYRFSEYLKNPTTQRNASIIRKMRHSQYILQKLISIVKNLSHVSNADQELDVSSNLERRHASRTQIYH